jgi:putative inorganic carbon (HCO3(-)) transporter
VMYLIVAMVTGHYVGARQRLPGLRGFTLGHDWLRWVSSGVGSIAGLFVLVAILLKTSG